MLRRFLYVFLGFYLIYVIAGNWFVNSSKLAALLDTWDDGVIHYKYGVTPFPGVVWIKDLSFWHQDKNVLWNARAKSVATILWIPALLKKEIHFSWVRVSETNFRFNQKKKLKDDKKVGLGMYASLEFPRPPRPKKPPGRTEDKWGIEMKRVTVTHLVEAWVDEYRYLGDALVKGGFHIMPDKAVTVGPASVEFHPGKFYLGNKLMGEELAGSVNYVMHAFHPDAPDEDVYHSISLALDLGLKTKTLAPANVYLGAIHWIRFQDGSGPIRIHLIVDKGKIADSTHIDFETKELALDLGRFRATSGAAIHWKVDKGNARLDARLQGLRITDPQDGEGIVQNAGLALTADTTDLDIADSPFKEIKLGFRLAKAQVPKLTSLNRFFPAGSPLLFESGSAVIETVLSGTRENEKGVLDFHASQARLRYGERILQTSLVCKMPFQNASRKKGHFDVRDGFLSVTDLQFLSDKSPEKWWGEFEFPSVIVSSQPTVNVEGKFKVRMADTSPIIKILRPNTGEDLLTRFLTSNQVRSSGDFAVKKHGFSVNHFDLNSDPLKIKGFYSVKNKIKNAQLLIAREPFALGLEFKKDNRRIILQDAYGWWAKESTPRAIAE